MKNNITLSQAQVLRILTDLEFVITSADRLGSAGLSERLFKTALHDFIVDGDVFRRLAAVRHEVILAVDRAVSAQEVHALEAKLEKIKPWKPKS